MLPHTASISACGTKQTSNFWVRGLRSAPWNAESKIAKWWMPDDVAFVAEIPHTATGKIQKTTLRQQFKDYVLPTVQAAE